MKTMMFGFLLAFSSLASAATITIQNAASSQEAVFSVDRNGWMKIPTEFKMNRPTLNPVKVEIFYNVTDIDHEFSCRFESLKASRKVVFKKCVNQLGDVLINSSEDLSQLDFPIDRGTKIKMMVNRKVSLKATHQADWR
jgi:hypothetical protein